jgi:SAM-dependent methyltransferase
VLCFVPDPEAVVAGVARALRPGGTFAIQDYYHYRGVHLAPYSAAFDRVFDATDKSWRMHGGDPNIAGRLPAMLRRNGLRVTDVRSLVRSARPDSLLWQWPTTFFRVYVPRLVDMGLLTPAEAQEFHAEWNRRSSDPDAVFCTPPMLEIIGVKA